MEVVFTSTDARGQKFEDRDFVKANTIEAAQKELSSDYGYRDYIISDVRKANIVVDIKTLEKVLKYCENQSIYDKLSCYGDFYYKLKNTIREQNI